MKDLKWLFLGIAVLVLVTSKAARADCAVGISIDIMAEYQGTDITAGYAYDDTSSAGPSVIDYIVTVSLTSGQCPVTRGQVYLNLPDGSNVTLADKTLELDPGQSVVYDVDWNPYAVGSADLNSLPGATADEVRATAEVNVIVVRDAPLGPQDAQGYANWDITVIHPGTMVGISASPTEVVTIGTDVELTITEKNTGDVSLVDPYVELEPLGLILEKSSGEYFGGDTDGDGELGVGETWEWRVDDNDVSDTETYWVTGHGIDALGNDVTWCSNPQDPPVDTLCDANEANEVTVYRIDPATEVGILAWPMEVSPAGTDVTLTITEENTGDANLTDPCVVLEPLGVTLTKGSPDYNDGDADGDGELDVGEMWTWIVVDLGVDADRTYTVTGDGRDPLGNEVTWCSNPGDPPADTLCDANEQDEVTVNMIYCSTLVDISVSPTEVVPIGTDVTLTITEENIGDCNLTDPCVVLEPLNLTLTKASPQYDSGDDDGDGELDVYEQWTWIVTDEDVNDTKTYTATGHGIDPLRNDVTWCSNPEEPPADTLCDANEQDVVTVSLIYCGTLVAITASPMEVSPVGTDVMLVIGEENTGDANLVDPYVELEPLGLVLDKSSLDYSSGDDDGDGELDVGETWIWAVTDEDVTDTKTYTVIGHGTGPLGNDVTWCANSVEPPEDTYCDPNERDAVTVNVIYCSTLVDISAEPMEVSPVGTDVNLTITEENIGDTPLTDPCVVLEPLGLTLNKASSEYSGGDVDGNDVLDIGEIWTWLVVDHGVGYTKVYTVIGHGTDPLGNEVTWCENSAEPPEDTLCDANERDELTVGVIYCGTLAAITASPMEVSRVGTDVTLMIGEENTGDANLTDPYVELEPLGLTLDKDSPHYQGGDDGDDELGVGEMWIWAVIDTDVNDAKTYTVIGHGTDPLGNDVTWCEDSLEPPADTYCDPNELDEVMVGLLYCSTALDISASPMEVSPVGTDVTLTITEKNIGDAALTDPCVVLEPLGLTLKKGSPEYIGGDSDGNDVLNAGETWTWIVVDAGVNNDKTYTAIGHGTNRLGNDVTWCSNPAEPPGSTICDANERDEVTVGVLYCSTVLDILASPVEVSPVGTDVTLTITEENIGDAALTDPCVVLEPLGLTLTKASVEYSGGDSDGNDVLDAGETWTWIVVDRGVNNDKTYTAIGHGTNPLGNDVTWCSNPAEPPANTLCDANELDQVAVNVIYCDTVIDISASPMQVSGATDVTLTITEKNTGDVDLTDPCVVLEPLGRTLTKAPPEYIGGDSDGNDVLDAGETWTWIIVDPGVDNDKTYTVVGHGTDAFGNDVTWCSNPGDPPAGTLCDQDERDEVTVERIGGIATRTPGFWKTHVEYAEHIFNVHCGGLIDLGWVVVDSNEDIFGVFWAHKSRNTNGSRRSELCRARIHASFHALAAILNSCLHNGAPLPKTPVEIATILGGTNRSAIIELAGQLGAYNESGDEVTIIDNDGFAIGNADPAAAKAGANYAVANCLNGVGVSKKGGKGKKK
ncbi:MAG: COG1361 family protein [Planctomycetota bacterium]|jgi:hypothetical protein